MANVGGVAVSIFSLGKEQGGPGLKRNQCLQLGCGLSGPLLYHIYLVQFLLHDGIITYGLEKEVQYKHALVDQN